MDAPLFDDGPLTTTGVPEESGFFARDGGGHRWIQQRARFNVARPAGGEWLWLTMSGPGWRPGGRATIAVRADGAFCGVAEVGEYADHYFRVGEGHDDVRVEIEVLSDCSGAPDPRALCIALHRGGIVEDGDGRRGETGILRDQLGMLSGNPMFRDALAAQAHKQGARGIDLGGGTGVLSALIAAANGARMACVDMLPFDAADAQPPRAALHGLLQRNRRTIVDALGIPADRLDAAPALVGYHDENAEALPFRDGYFDFAVSLNAFEHIRDPGAALAEIERVLRPGGWAFVQFSPIFLADAGSHLFDQGILDIPWAPLLMSRERIRALVAERGGPLHRVDPILDSLNERPTQYYRDMFASTRLQVELLEETTGCVIPGAEQSEYFARASALHPARDLLVQGFKAFLRKKA